MSKIGYNCIVWSEEHNTFLEDNYAFMNNEELAKAINKKFSKKGFELKRTPDAVRKQLNTLKLKRPKKSDIKKLDKKAGKDNFFKNIKIGNEQRKKIEAEKERIQKQEQNKQKEREWASKVYGVGTVEKPAVVQPKKNTKEMVWLDLDDKTRIQIPKGEEEIWRVKYTKYKINKYGF